MGTISHINGVAVANISHVNGVAKANISAVNGQTFPSSDSVSLNPTNLYYYASGNPKGNSYTYVTSSGAWTALVTSDTDGIISSHTTSGSGSGNMYVYVNYNDMYDECSFAIIRVTCGTAIAYLYVYRDGNVNPC